MQVTVHYVAQLRRAAGCGSEPVEVEPGATVNDLLCRLAQNRDESFHKLLLGDTGCPHASLLVFVGEQPAEFSGVLADGAEVTILTPMAGG